MRPESRRFFLFSVGTALLCAVTAEEVLAQQNYPVRPVRFVVPSSPGGGPEIPTLAEAGVPGYEAVQWFGVLAPAGTPRPIITRLHNEVVRTLLHYGWPRRLSRLCAAFGGAARLPPPAPWESAGFVLPRPACKCCSNLLRRLILFANGLTERYSPV